MRSLMLLCGREPAAWQFELRSQPDGSLELKVTHGAGAKSWCVGAGNLIGLDVAAEKMVDEFRCLGVKSAGPKYTSPVIWG